MKESELFWSVYKNLEHEVIEISKYIHFSSDQKNMYSMKIADIIVRCAIEIESLSKKLYKSLGGNMNLADTSGNPRDLYFDTDCLAQIERLFHLSKKEIIISSSTFYFDEADRIITPLHKASKRGTSGSKWKQAYQALKHDRYSSLKRNATIENMINALGALYILNLYFRDITYPLKETFSSFDTRVNSEVFSIFTYDATHINITAGTMDDSSIQEQTEDNLNRAIYIIKCSDKYFVNVHEAMKKDDNETIMHIMSSSKVKQYIYDHPGYQPNSFIQLTIDALGQDAPKQFFSINNLKQYLNIKEWEAILNKHGQIYPSLN